MVATSDARLMMTPQTLSNRAVLQLSGDNVLAFLHNILTCDVAELPAQNWAYGALLSPQGKIQHDMFVGHDGARVFIDCAAAQVEALLQKLKLYRLRAKIDIAHVAELKIAVSDAARVGLLSALDPRFAEMGYRSIVAATALGADGDYHSHRIACGMADSDADIGVNQLFPHEANFDLLGGVSFSKGCYVGQEVVSRMQHRGTARSRILPVASMGKLPAPQTAITSGETVIGTLLSNDGTLGIALIRIDRWNAATAPIMAGTVAISLRTLSWLPTSISEPATL